MPLHSLIKSTSSGRPDYKVIGDFEKLMFFCPDIRGDYKDKASKELKEKTQEELSVELRKNLKGLSELAFTWLENKLISDYWLVITPELCDQIQANFPTCQQPNKNGNYIVTPFYTDDIDLVDALCQKIPSAFGTVNTHPDPRRRRGTDANLSIYLACEVNEESEYFDELKNLEKSSEEYKRKFGPALLAAELDLGSAVADHLSGEIRTFLQYGEDDYGPKFVEQYFNSKASKKINGYALGEGYVRNRFAKVNLDKNGKYAAFHDLFASTGYQFADYALSKEDLKKKLTEFEDNPWVKFPIE